MKEDGCQLLNKSEAYDHQDINKYTRYVARYSDEKTRLLVKLIKIMEPKPTCAVLDIGCGEGYLLKSLSGLVSKCVGIDPDLVMIRTARRKLGKHSNVEILRSKFEDYKTDQTFDIVITSHTMSFFKDKVAIVNKMIHYVKEGGILIIVGHAASSQQIRILEKIHFGLTGRSILHISSETLYNCMKYLGFSPNMQFLRTRVILPSADAAIKLSYFLFRVAFAELTSDNKRLINSLLMHHIKDGKISIETTHGIVILKK